MKRRLAVIGLLALVAGCANADASPAVPQDSWDREIRSGFHMRGLYAYDDPAKGVTCYVWFQSGRSDAISCVKVKP